MKTVMKGQKLRNLTLLALFIVLIGCKPSLEGEYYYETNPEYTQGLEYFYGSYYAKYANSNNVAKLLLFTKGLALQADNKITGFGQYLVLSDVFIPASDTLLPVGVYTISESKEAFTALPGKIFKSVDLGGRDYLTGASLHYREPADGKSKTELITGGSFTLKLSAENELTITCRFQTKEGKELAGYGKIPIKSFPVNLDLLSVAKKSCCLFAPNGLSFQNYTLCLHQ